MEVSQQAATEGGSSQNRSPTRRNKDQQPYSTDHLKDKRPRTETDSQPRRSLRIFTKQKLTEEHLLQLSSFSVPVLTRNPSIESEKQGSKVNVTTERKTSTDSAASNRKRKRSVSPTPLSTPRKQVKRSPSKKISKRRQDLAEISCATVVTSPEPSAKKKGRSKVAKVEKEVTCASNIGEEETESEEGKRLGASIDKAQQKRKKRPRRLKESELVSALSGSDLEGSSRKGKASEAFRVRNKGTSSGKQRRKVSWKKGSAVNLMASPENIDPPVPTGGERTGDSGSQSDQATGTTQESMVGRQGSNEGGLLMSEEEPSLEPFLALDEGTRRLQGMPSIPGLPHHLLGALGSRMHYMMQKSFSNSMSSSNNSRAQQLLAGVEAAEDEGLQLQSCIEIGQLLVMGNEETLSGFPVKQAVPALVKLLSMEHNFDMMVNACRALTYMMEALPRSSLVVAHAIPILVEKLQVIQCMDVAEQALSALEILSKRHGKAILQAGGLSACLLYLEFFSIVPQRSALSIASNCCQTVTEDYFLLIKDALPILSGRLQHQDKRSVESCCLCFSRLVESFASNKRILEELASSDLLPSLQQLLVISPPIISSVMFVTVLKMMSTMCASCPSLAVQLLKLNIADTLRYLLVGSGEVTLENIELMTRSPNEVYEILSLMSEMMPPLPSDGVFEVEELMTIKKQISSSVQWEWQESALIWRPYGRIENKIIEAAYQVHEDECSVGIMGNAYVVDLSGLQQINEDTGTTRAVRRTILEPPKKASPQEGRDEEEDERGVALREDSELVTSFIQALFGLLYEVFNSMAGPAVRIKCLKTILRILYHAESGILCELLKDISVSSHLATMLKAQDYRLVVGAMQMAEVLMQKLPSIFTLYFHREGVMHQLRNLRDIPLRMLSTPKQEIVGTLLSLATTSTVVPIVGPSSTSMSPISAQTPTSTRKRLSDIFKKGKRHFRKTLRGRADDQEAGGAVASPPCTSTSINSFSSTQSMVEGKSLPSLLPHPTLLTPTFGDGASGGEMKTESGAAGGSDVGGGGADGGHKERIQHWIQQQASDFLEKWAGKSSSNPIHAIVTRLKETTQELDYKSPTCLTALNNLCGLLVEPDSNISAFEFMHYQVHSKLLNFLTLDCPEAPVRLNTRLRHFLHVFMALPTLSDRNVSLDSWVDRSSSGPSGVAVLLTKLHGCINQLEQFPVRVHELPGRRGSHALKFFNSHQIKCTLERHPSSLDTNSWKGGVLRIDPLATIQTLEKYLLVRGFGKTSEPGVSSKGARRLDDDSEDSEVDESMVMGLTALGTDKHFIEFLLGDRVLPYNITVFQAIKQYGVESGHQEGEEEIMPLGRPEFWVHAHTLYYRVVPSDKKGQNSGQKPHQVASASLPATPIITATPFPSSRKQSWSGSAAPPSSGGRRRGGSNSSKLLSLASSSSSLPVRVTRSGSGHANIHTPSSPPDPPPRITRRNTANVPLLVPPSIQAPEHKHMSVASLDIETSKEKTKSARLIPLHQALIGSCNLKLVCEDPSLPALKLLKAVHAISIHWTDIFPGLAGNPLLPLNDFINNKLTAKATRQLQDSLNVITGNFPSWLHNLASNCMFLFPFECRQSLFYLSTFDRDRAIARLQDQRPDMNSGDSQQMVTPRLEKKKRCVSRDNLLKQAEKLMDELAANKALLEIHYQDEVGTGLGPTLEFYTLVSRELQRSDLMLFRGDLCLVPESSSMGASTTFQYIHSPTGLFPAPLGPSSMSIIVDDVCAKFKFMGKLMAKAIMDSRMLDMPLSEAFYKWMLGLEGTFTAQDLQHVDPIVARSFAQLAAVAVKKHSLESDPLLTGKALAVGVEALTLEGGGSVEDLDLDFTLPGCADIELKPGGKDLAVTIHNLDDYLKLVVDWSLVRGVARQMEAFKDGFNSVFPLSSMHGLLHASEMDMMICGAHLQKWDIKDLMEYCRPDHGYSHDSRAIQFLFEVLSGLESLEQRHFIQFVTGSPRLPVGGFKSLSPQLTIVRKMVESTHNPDDFLPSVMTCVNYLKLPDYSTVAIMKEKLHFAMQEGKHSFHLS